MGGGAAPPPGVWAAPTSPGGSRAQTLPPPPSARHGPHGDPAASHGDRDECPALKLRVTGMGTLVQIPSVSSRAPPCSPREGGRSLLPPGLAPRWLSPGWVMWGAGMVVAPCRAEPCADRVGCQGPHSLGKRSRWPRGQSQRWHRDTAHDADCTDPNSEETTRTETSHGKSPGPPSSGHAAFPATPRPHSVEGASLCSSTAALLLSRQVNGR